MRTFASRRNRCKSCRKDLRGGFYTSRSENGKAKPLRYSGGFYPSAMGSILTSGPFFATAAFFQGRRLISNNTERMRARAKGKSRGSATRKAKRT